MCSTVLVKFLIGPSKEEYHLSKPLVASLSVSLSDTLSDLSSETYEGANAKPVDWSNHIDTDIFNLFVQYAYTGGYDFVREENVLRNQQVYSEARKNDPDAFWIYESSPFVETPTPASTCRQHAQIWAFSRFHEIYRVHDLGEVAEQHLRATLQDLMWSSPSRRRSVQAGDYFNLEEDQFREVVDVIGYIYHQGRRFWGSEIKAEVHLVDSGMRSTVAWFARKYLYDCGQNSVHHSGNKQLNLKIWKSLLEKEPLIAVDMVCHDPKTVTW